jgi:hypothetical protein
VKYRLTRDDGSQLDVAGILWECFLELAYTNGWRPSGTDAPRDGVSGVAPVIGASRWTRSDYFSASSQYVRAADACALGTAALHGQDGRGDESTQSQRKRGAEVRKLASFAQCGGFIIGRAPEAGRSS